MPNIIDNLGAGRYKRKKRKPKVLTWRNKHLARDIARSCDIPYEEARKVLEVIIKMLQVKLKSARILTIRKFGRFKYSKLKRPNNRAAYRIITFIPSRVFSAYLGNALGYHNFKYEVEQSRKIRRLLLAGDRRKAKLYYERLIIRLDNNPVTKKFLTDKKYFPIKFGDSIKSNK